MSILKRFKQWRARVDDERFWTEFFGKFGSTSASGKVVTPDTALQISTVFACIKVLSETVASLPLNVYKRIEAGGKELATEHPLFPILHDIPNEIQNSYELREMMTGHINLRGNAYALKEVNQLGRIMNLWPLNPVRMEVEVNKEGRELEYKYTTESGQQIAYPAKRIWHVRGFSTDGLVGLSPITLAANAIGLAISSEDHGSKFFANDATPTGILSTPGKMSEDAGKKLKESWQEAQSNENKMKTALLHGGLEWKQIGISNQDSQFLETRQFQIEEIARIYRVPSLMINHPDKTNTYASAEQFFLGFVVHVVVPWVKRYEQSINKQLLTDKDRADGFFAEFNVAGLLRGDVKSRNESYAIGRQWGYLSVNDIRRLENLNPVENGDIYLQPLNMVEAGSVQLPTQTNSRIEKKQDEFVFSIPFNVSDIDKRNGGNDA